MVTSLTLYKLYQTLILMVFNKMVKYSIFHHGDLVVVIKQPMVMTYNPRQVSSIVKTIDMNGAYQLAKSKSKLLMFLVNKKISQKILHDFSISRYGI